jgi:hypothetical protein
MGPPNKRHVRTHKDGHTETDNAQRYVGKKEGCGSKSRALIAINLSIVWPRASIVNALLVWPVLGLVSRLHYWHRDGKWERVECTLAKAV